MSLTEPMGMSAFRRMVSCVLLLIVPASLFAADQPAAMLYSHGAALLNGNSIARSSAIFSGDLIQTNADSAANINASGSIVLVLNDSLVQYQGNAVMLEHGGVTISTSKLLATRAGDVTVSPAATVWTEFEVRDVDGRVQIAARKGDLTIRDDQGTTTLPQGQQTTRDESQPQDNSQSQDDNKKKKERAEGGPVAPAAGGGTLNSPVAIGIGGAVIVGVTAWVLSRSSAPASPSVP
jgi:ferric-dicitrate binding protein FerR (iron transport regulator)